MTAVISFGLSMVGHLAGETAGQVAELVMEYAPQPPFGVGRPELAPPNVLAMASQILADEMPNAVAHETAKRRGFTL